jgi:predicted membrane-bound mannosyltransferase
MLALVDTIESTADRAGTGRDTGIVFMMPEYWPLPWYFRDYPKAGFFGEIVDTQEAMIVANVNQQDELAPKIAGKYRLVRQFNLRPGVDLVLYVRSDIPNA